MSLCPFHTVMTKKDFPHHLTAVTKTMSLYQRSEEQRFVTKKPFNVVILVDKANNVNWTCLSTIALFQQNSKDWIEQPCDSQKRIDFVTQFRRGEEPVRLCTDNQL